MEATGVTVAPHTAAGLREWTRAAGLALGARACLALARERRNAGGQEFLSPYLKFNRCETRYLSAVAPE